MGIPRRYVIIASSIILLLTIAITLATSIEIRAAPAKLTQIYLAQQAKNGEFDTLHKVAPGGKINGTSFDRGDVINGNTTIAPIQGSTLFIDGTSTRLVTGTTAVSTTAGEGMIGMSPTARPTSTEDAGFIGEKTTAIPSQTAVPAPPPPRPVQQLPILAFSYDGSGGPKHCRGNLLQKLEIPQPASQWQDGTCVDLPSQAQCGVFFAGKDAGCEAQLFNAPRCLNTTRTYVNTVVFMPEERIVGALWSSMWITCGVMGPEVGMIDPAILGGLLKPKPKVGGG